jgi:hypothetical protein
MHQDAFHLRSSFLLASDAISVASAARTGPGLARVRIELARPGRIGAEFDNRSTRPRGVQRPDADRRS